MAASYIHILHSITSSLFIPLTKTHFKEKGFSVYQRYMTNASFVSAIVIGLEVI